MAESKGEEGVSRLEDSSRPKKSRRRRRHESDARYVYKVLQQVRHECGMTEKGMQVMCDFVGGVRGRILVKANELATQCERKTLKEQDIRAATILVLPGQLGTHAVKEGEWACKKYRNNEGTDKKRPSARAGLVFPVGRYKRYIGDATKKRVAESAPIYLAAACEYLVAEILDPATTRTLKAKRKWVTPRDIQLAIGNDTELKKLFRNDIIAFGGVGPNINPALLPKKKKRKKRKTAADCDCP